MSTPCASEPCSLAQRTDHVRPETDTIHITLGPLPVVLYCAGGRVVERDDRAGAMERFVARVR